LKPGVSADKMDRSGRLKAGTNEMCPLSPREAEILRLGDEGKSLKEIAAGFGCSVNTVKTHAHRILIKTAATRLSHAAFRIGGARIPAPGNLPAVHSAMERQVGRSCDSRGVASWLLEGDASQSLLPTPRPLR